MGFRQTRTGRDWRLDHEHMDRGGCECYLRELDGYHLTVEHTIGGKEGHWCSTVCRGPDGDDWLDGEFCTTKRTAMAWAVEFVDRQPRG